MDRRATRRALSMEANVPLFPGRLPDSGSCPREGHSLTRREIVGIEFFFCKTCHGLWFSPEALADLTACVIKGIDPPMSLASCRPPAIEEGTARCLCPGHPLMESREKDGVTVDQCPSCGGVWLDGGEIAEILGTGGPVPTPLPGESAARSAASAFFNGLEYLEPLYYVGKAVLYIGRVVVSVIGH